MRIHEVIGGVLALLGYASQGHAKPGKGTIDDPLVVDAFPYVAAGSTAGASSEAIDSYSCSPSTDESGPEVLYRFTLSAPARVTAWVEGDGGGVDIDVHLLDSLEIQGGVASACLDRDNVIAEAEMAAGQHYVVVDSFKGESQAGPYVLHLEAIGDAWIDRPVAEGVRWRARRFADLHGPQVVHELWVDTLLEGVEIRAYAASGCQTVGAVGAAKGAVAGINGGYFGPGCAPVSLLKAGGSLVGTNSVSRGAFGLTAEQAPLVQVVPKGKDWPEAHHAHGGGPVLVSGGAAKQGNAAWAEEGFTSGGFNGDNPRTFAGFDAQGQSHLVTVDGRRPNAKGMSLDELAGLAASADLSLAEATNLDGGGSTTMWIAGATPNGVVNYPSDAQQEQSTHPGSRPCSGGLFVFAPPYNHPPRFQTKPPLEAKAGEPYSYDADAIDLDVDDTVTFALASGPAGASIDAASGVLDYAPTVESPPSVEVVIEASDPHGAVTEQSYTLAIEGGLGGSGGAGGSGDAGGEGGSSANGGAGGANPIGGLPAGGATEGACGCRAAGQPSRAPLGWLALLVLARAARGRRVRSSSMGFYFS